MVFFEQASRIRKQDLVDNGLVFFSVLYAAYTPTQFDKQNWNRQSIFATQPYILRSLFPIVCSVSVCVCLSAHRGFPCTKHTIDRIHDDDDDDERPRIARNISHTRTRIARWRMLSACNTNNSGQYIVCDKKNLCLTKQNYEIINGFLFQLYNYNSMSWTLNHS